MQFNGREIRLLGSVLFLAASALVGSPPAVAQPYPVPQTWDGGLSSRPRLTGDWGGTRDELGAKGVVLDVDLLINPMDNLSGGKSTGGDTWGNADYTLNIDTQKLGLWPGGFFKLSGDSSFGTAVNNTGAVVPINTAYLIPAPNERTTALMNISLMQFLSPKLGLVIGKLNLLDFSEQEFYGDYRTQFLNTAFNFPMTTVFSPISAFGGGVIALPTKDITLSLLALGSNNTPASNDIGDAFSDGTTVEGGGALTIRPFGLVGHQSVSFLWSSQNRFSLEQDPSNLAHVLLLNQYPRLNNPGPLLEQILARYFPGLTVPPAPPIRKKAAGLSATRSINTSGSPRAIPGMASGCFSHSVPPTATRTPSRRPFSQGSAARGYLAARMTRMVPDLHAPSSAALSFPCCASSSVSDSITRMHSRCTTTLHSPAGLP